MPRPISPDDIATAQRVLAAASLRDPRMPRPTNDDAAGMVAALAEDLAGINPDTALAAVSTHYRESADRIMPAHIWAIARRTASNPAHRSFADALASAECRDCRLPAATP